MRSLAIPSTCIGTQTCASLVQATFTLYQISRACVLYGIDEIIVFQVPEPQAEEKAKKITFDEAPDQKKSVQWETKSAADLLQFFLVPKHLQKLVFPDLKPFVHAKKLPRVWKGDKNLVQGIAIRKHIEKKKTKKSKKEKADARVTPYINFGFDSAFEVEDQVPLHSRVAIDLKTKKIHQNIKCGYSVRTVDEFSKLFTETSVPEGYSHTFYAPCQEFFQKQAELTAEKVTSLPSADARVLLIISDWQSLSRSVEADPQLEVGASDLLDGYIDGLRGARLEDAVTIALSTVFGAPAPNDVGAA